jgi:ELWxxDGT repeat protein
MRTCSRLFLVCLLCALPTLGLEPYLVKDINPVGEVTGSSPSDFVSVGGGVGVFTAFDGAGLGLWRSDGTPAGTWQVADLCPEGTPSCGSVVILAVAEGRCFLTLGTGVWVTDGTTVGTLHLTDDLSFASDGAWVPEQRALYFAGTDIAHGQELWRTDGTPAGTYRVVDLEPGPKPSLPWALTAFRGRVWFGARTGAQGGAVWRSDGTPGGTVPVYRTGRQVIPVLHGIVGGRLVFSEPFGRDGHRLWATDGTARGTTMLVRLPHHMRDAVIQNGRLFFISADAGRGQELWASDGTPRGTRVLSNIPGMDAFFDNAGTYALYLPRTSAAGRLVFRAWDPVHGIEPWVSDGTPAGTRLIKDLCPGPCRGADQVLMSSQGLFYFTGSDGTHGVEPWASDGTAAGTRMVRDLCPGLCGSDPRNPARFKGRLLFSANDGTNGRELWSTDGSGPGTVRITDLNPDDPVYSFQGVALGGRFLFAADDGAAGSEPWSTDGTLAGSAPVADINQADFGGSVISGIRSLGDQALFFADDGVHGFELWKSDGMPADTAGTTLVADLLPGPEPELPPVVVTSAEAGGKLFLLLLGDLGHGGFSIWRTDGTAAGTLLLRDSSAGLVPWGGSDLRAAGGTVYFTLFDSDLGPQLWATDGTVTGTRPVADGAFSNPMGLAEMGGRLYFFAAAPDGAFGLWTSDGTAAGTVNVKRFGSDFGALPRPTVYAGRLWFFATAAPGEPRLWSSDGTAAGTRVESLPGIPRPVGGFMASTGAKLMISGYIEGSGFKLWATDGTPEGTREVGPAADNDLAGIPWTVFQGRLVYAVDELFDGHPMLWLSDGTPEGTGPLLDHDGQPVPAPLGLAVLGDHLVFTTATPARIWESDGTAAGTKPIAPARPLGLNPGAVGRAGNRVFFGAWDPATGQELWAVEPAAP